MNFQGYPHVGIHESSQVRDDFICNATCIAPDASRIERNATVKGVESVNGGITLQMPEPKNEAEKQDMQKDQEMAQKLEGMSGRDFDKTFLEMMAMGHAKAVAMLTQAHGMTKDPELKDMLGKMIPILRQHEVVAQKLQSSLTSPAAG